MKQIGRKVKTLEGEEKRFIIMYIPHNKYGLYDAEVDNFVLVQDLNVLEYSKDINLLTKKLEKVKEIFEQKIKELENA